MGETLNAHTHTPTHMHVCEHTHTHTHTRMCAYAHKKQASYYQEPLTKKPSIVGILRANKVPG